MLNSNNEIYNDLFKTTCNYCGLEQVPFHDEIDGDGCFQCCHCKETVQIDDFRVKNKKWMDICNN